MFLKVNFKKVKVVLLVVIHRVTLHVNHETCFFLLSNRNKIYSVSVPFKRLNFHLSIKYGYLGITNSLFEELKLTKNTQHGNSENNSQQTFICLKSTIEALEKDVKYVQS